MICATGAGMEGAGRGAGWLVPSERFEGQFCLFVAVPPAEDDLEKAVADFAAVVSPARR